MADQNPDIKRLVEALRAKAEHHNTMWDYYTGNQKLKWTADRLHKVFKDFNVVFKQNWCEVVVTSLTERVQFIRYSSEEKEKNTALNEIVKDLDLLLETEDVHEEVSVVGESFIIAGHDDDGNLEVYHNDARTVHAFYDPNHPKKMTFAGKMWKDPVGKRAHVVLYYDDHLEFWENKAEGEGNVYPTTGWVPSEEGDADNTYGQIPVFHFRRGARSQSDLHNILVIQDAVNKIISDMMVTAEFAAMPQRYIISGAEQDGKIPYGPNSTLEIPAGDGDSQPTSVGTFPAADMDNFLGVIDNFVSSIAIISRTPKHYFLQQSGDPSGEALIAMESPLNRKASRFVQRMTPTWRSLGEFLYALDHEDVSNMPESEDGKKNRLDVVFDDVETVQPLTDSIILQNNVNAGIPLITQLRRKGWTEEELTALQEDQAKSTTPATDQGQKNAPQASADDSIDGQAAAQDVATERQATAIKSALLQALEAVNIDLVDRLTASGALDRMRKPKEEK